MKSQSDRANGRAYLARPLLCLGFVYLACLVGATAAGAAAPRVPALTATNPPSFEAHPADSTTPLVTGESEPEGGIIIQGTKPSLLFANTAMTRSLNPSFEIVIYNQPECKGVVVGVGDARTLESSGIQVSVAADTLTVLSAKQIDPADSANPSGCSAPLLYWEGNVPVAGGGSGGGSGSLGSSGGSGGSGGSNGGDASGGVGSAVSAGKPEPPRLHMSPKATANDNTPEVAGVAPGAASVLVYASSGCSGTPLAKGSAAELAAGFTIQVADNTTTSFSAISIGGQRSSCSSPVTYVEDSIAPRTRVTMAPGVKTRKRKAVFRFADAMADQPGTTFYCKLDKAKWKRCASPLRLKHLRLRRHIVRVRAVDLAGNAEKRGAKRSFTVVRPS